MADTLYSIDKGGTVRVWKIWAKDGVVHTKYGIEGGVMQHSRKECFSKNEGKVNETSPKRQAHLEKAALIKLQLRKKYYHSIEEAKASLQDKIAPMLAHDYRKHGKKLCWPVFVQPKLDGFRCLAFREEANDAQGSNDAQSSNGTGTVFLQSRGNKPILLPHISKALGAIFKAHPTLVLDGELYIHRMPFQEISSLIRRPREDSERVHYWIYDAYFRETPNMAASDRRSILTSMFGADSLLYLPPLLNVPTYECSTEEDVFAKHADFLAAGFEGTIIRDQSAPYLPGHRSSKLLKLKDFQDAEYEIIDVEEGRGKMEGCAIFVCQTPEGRVFRVSPQGTEAERIEMWENGDSLIGKLLTVKYFECSNDGVPRFPSGLRIREPE